MMAPTTPPTHDIWALERATAADEDVPEALLALSPLALEEAAAVDDAVASAPEVVAEAEDVSLSASGLCEPAAEAVFDACPTVNDIGCQ